MNIVPDDIIKYFYEKHEYHLKKAQFRKEKKKKGPVFTPNSVYENFVKMWSGIKLIQ